MADEYEGQSFSLDEYADRIADDAKRNRTKALLVGLFWYSSQVHKLDGESIRILQSTEKGADVISFGDDIRIVRLCSGLLDYALDLTISENESSEIRKVARLPDGFFAPGLTFLCWVISHELAHLQRAHALVVPNPRNDVLSSRALEKDADLVAVAKVFHWLQYVFQGKADALSIKSLLLRDLHRGIRGLPEPGENSTHVGGLARIFDLQSKLSILREDPNEQPDPDGRTQETRICMDQLMHLYIALERLHAARIGIGFDVLLAETIHFAESEGWRAHGDRWDDIKAIVAEKSGTRT